MNGILRAIVDLAFAATDTAIVVDHRGPAAWQEAALDVARAVLREVHAHAAARTAKTDLEERVHLVIAKTPDQLFDLHPKRLTGEPERRSAFHAFVRLFFRELDRHAVIDHYATAEIEEEAGEVVRIALAVAASAAKTFFHAADELRFIDRLLH